MSTSVSPDRWLFETLNVRADEAVPRPRARGVVERRRLRRGARRTIRLDQSSAAGRHTRHVRFDARASDRGFPAAGHVAVKDRVNAISLPPVEDFRRDSDLFGEGVGSSETQRLTRAAFGRGFQTADGEIALGSMLADLNTSGRA